MSISKHSIDDYLTIDKLPLPVLVVEIESLTVTHANEPAMNILEYNYSEIEGINFSKLLPEKTSQQYGEEVIRENLINEQKNLDLNLKTRDDELRKFKIRTKLQATDSGSLCLMFFEEISNLREQNLNPQGPNQQLRNEEKSIEVKHDFLERLVNQAPGAVYQYKLFPDGSSFFPYASAGIYGVYEVTPFQVVDDASRVFDRLHPDDYRGVVESIQSSAENLTLWNHEYRVKLPEKGLRWLEGRAKPEELSDGSILWHGNIRDITDQKKYQDKIKEYKTAIESSVQGIAIAEEVKEGQKQVVRLEYVNVAFARLHGYSRDEMIGLKLQDIHPEEISGQLMEIHQQVRKGKRWIGETKNERKDGTVFPSLVSSTLFVDRADQKKYIASCQDITDLKKNEELSAANQQLRAAEQQLEARNQELNAINQQLHTIKNDLNEKNKFLNEVIEALDHPFYVINADDYTIELANSAAGFKPQEELKTCYELTHHRGEPCSGDHPCALEEIKKTGQPARLEHVHFSPEGKKRIVAVHGYPFFDSSGKLTRIIEYSIDITEQKKIEDRIRAANQQLRVKDNAIESAFNGIVISDQDGEIFYVNDAFVNMFGFENKEDAIGIHPLDLHPEDEQQKVKESLDIIREKGAWQSELKALKRDGELFDVQINTSRVRDQDGNVTCMISSFEDISKRKRFENTLKRTQSLAKVGSWHLKTAENNLVWSDEVYKIFGLEPQEFEATYEVFVKYVHPEDREKVDEAYTSSIEEGRNEYEVDHRIVREETGEVRYVREKCQHLKNHEGEIVESIGMVQDITKRKEREEEQRAANQQLRATEQQLKGEVKKREKREQELEKSYRRLNMAKEAGGIGIWEWDIRKDELIIDERIENLFGKKVSDSKEFVQLIHPDDQPLLRKKVAGCLETGGSFHLEFRVINPTLQKKYWLKIDGTLINNKDDNIRRIIGTALDITRRKLAEEDLRNFVYSASHDLKAPLRKMIGFSELLEEDLVNEIGQITDQLTDDINEIIDASLQMKELVDALLRFSRATRRKLEKKLIEMDTIVEGAIDSLSAESGFEKAKIEIDKLPQVYVDPALIKQVWQNLISNALKYSARVPEINITYSAADGKQVFGVKDNGLGIEKKYQEKIFKPFQRLFGRGEYEGSGIGLATCKKIVNRHGGKIWVESKQNEGSHFKFTLPEEVK